jgi:hypothetical protein
VVATWLTALACLGVALAFREPSGGREVIGAPLQRCREAWQAIVLGARHVFTARSVLLLLLAALLIDSFVRIFLTFASNYYRLIELPAFCNGLLGSGLALLGFAVAPVARRLVMHRSATCNFLLLAALVFAGLTGLWIAWPIWGAWVVLPFGLAMSGLQFFAAHYLNLWTDSRVRATVLSFRGVALNLGYAAAGAAFAGLNAHVRGELPGASENEIFGNALQWLAPTFFLMAIAGIAWVRLGRAAWGPYGPR